MFNGSVPLAPSASWMPQSKRGAKPMQGTTKCGAALASLALLTGCAGTMPRVVTADELCRDWRHQTISKRDQMTEETASQIEAGNKSRPAWGCAYGENRAS